MDLLLAVDPTSAKPLHRQVYDAIRSAILTGRLRPGDRLPATRTLADELSLSRNTVTEAYDQLQAEGYVFGKHGSGTYVAPNLPEDVLQVVARPQEQRKPEPPVRLSSWGQRAIAEPYRSLIRPTWSQMFVYDFRPHQVAADMFPWEAWDEAVQRAVSGDRSQLLAYPPSAGHSDLLEAIARHVARYRAVQCSPDQIVVVNGTQQGLNLLAHLLLEPGDRVGVEDPGYPTARLAFEARGLEVVSIPVDREGIRVNTMAEQKPVRLVHVTPSHQEPTGATLSLSRRLELLDLAEHTGCLIVEDDYDSEFRYEGRPVESLQGLDRQGLVIYAGTFSKSVLAGLRIGFMILPRRLVAPFVAAKSLWDSGAPMLEQAALAEFMRAGDYERHIRRMRRLYRDRRDALVESLQQHFGNAVTIGEHHGGLNVLVSLDVGVGREDLLARASNVGIGLRDAAVYYSTPQEQPTFLMGFAALTEATIRLGVERLWQVTRGKTLHLISTQTGKSLLPTSARLSDAPH